VEKTMVVRSAVQQSGVGTSTRYGYRRVTPELRRRGFLVNHKRVARIMRKDHLLAIGRRQIRGDHRIRAGAGKWVKTWRGA